MKIVNNWDEVESDYSPSPTQICISITEASCDS